jgi:hypothetical protein
MLAIMSHAMKAGGRRADPLRFAVKLVRGGSVDIRAGSIGATPRFSSRERLRECGSQNDAIMELF